MWHQGKKLKTDKDGVIDHVKNLLYSRILEEEDYTIQMPFIFIHSDLLSQH